jgi:hypothetical protein
MTKPGYHQMQGMIVRSFVGDMSQNCAWLQMIRDLRKHNAHGSIQMNEHRGAQACGSRKESVTFLRCELRFLYHRGSL